MSSAFADTSVIKLYAAELRGLSKEQVLLALSTKNLSTTQKNQILEELGLIANGEKLKAQTIQNALAQNGLNKEKQESILISLGLMDANTLELISQSECNQEMLEAMLLHEGVSNSQKRGILSSLGLGGANLTLAESFKMIKLQASQAWAALLANPLTPVIAGIAALVAGVFVAVKAYGHFTVTFDEAKEAAKKKLSFV